MKYFIYIISFFSTLATNQAFSASASDLRFWIHNNDMTSLHEHFPTADSCNNPLEGRNDAYPILVTVGFYPGDSDEGESSTALQYFLEKGTSTDVVDPENGNNPLHVAACNLNTECVRLLLEHSPFLAQKKNKEGLTPEELFTRDYMTEEGEADEDKACPDEIELTLEAFDDYRNCQNLSSKSESQWDLKYDKIAKGKKISNPRPARKTRIPNLVITIRRLRGLPY